MKCETVFVSGDLPMPMMRSPRRPDLAPSPRPRRRVGRAQKRCLDGLVRRGVIEIAIMAVNGPTIAMFLSDVACARPRHVRVVDRTRARFIRRAGDGERASPNVIGRLAKG